MTTKTSGWKTEEPPRDGSAVVAVGRIGFKEEFMTIVEDFCAKIFWEKDSSGYEGWHYYRGELTVAPCLDSEVRIDAWIEAPVFDEVNSLAVGQDRAVDGCNHQHGDAEGAAGGQSLLGRDQEHPHD